MAQARKVVKPGTVKRKVAQPHRLKRIDDRLKGLPDELQQALQRVWNDNRRRPELPPDRLPWRKDDPPTPLGYRNWIEYLICTFHPSDAYWHVAFPPYKADEYIEEDDIRRAVAREFLALVKAAKFKLSRQVRSRVAQDARASVEQPEAKNPKVAKNERPSRK